MRKFAAVLVVVAVGIFGLIAVSFAIDLFTDEDPQAVPTTTATSTTTPIEPEPEPEPKPEPEPEPGHISRSDMGKKWPLKVDSGELACDGSNGFGAVTFTAPDGTVYAVNGSASARDIGPIWANHPSIGKKNIGPLIERGLALCD
jgi:hypothetical protein